MPGHQTMPFQLARIPASRLIAAAALLTASLALAGCETTGTGVAQATPAPTPEPMSHTQAAEYCWMATEHGHADLPLDKRADIVEQCIKEKLAGKPADLKDDQQASAKKP